MKKKYSTYNILLVDDEITSRFATKSILSPNYQIHEAENKYECFEVLKKKNIHIVLLDLMIPGIIGFELLEKIKTRHPQTKVIILTSEYDVKKAVNAIQKNADDYIVKEAAKETLNTSIEKTLSILATERKVESLLTEAQAEDSEFIIPNHPKYRDIYNLAEKAAKKNLNILIQGKTGTGKDVLTRYIRKKTKPNAPIISVNCGAIPESLAEAELFGTEATAYTGAKERKGKLELANGGILFLDEIGNMPLNIQQKLLLALESKTITRIGSEQEITTDFLLISATNTDLEKDIETGKFREDLYYRIKDLAITIPSLEDVPEVIPELIRHFVRRYNTQYGENFTPSIDFYAYIATKVKGNIRSLKKEIQTIIALGELPKTLNHKPISKTNFSLKTQLENIEQSLIIDALESSKNIISKAAQNLGLKRTTLTEKIKKYDINESNNISKQGVKNAKINTSKRTKIAEELAPQITKRN